MNMDNGGEILLCIKCITYNHEPFIRQCLDGFVMQKTNFRFVAIVHDDASTDGTTDIIREYEEKYPDIIKPIYETENQYSKRDGSLGRIMNDAINATGCKYIAMCEGDDYWIDPLKLQKQVDFLDANPEYGMCYTNFNIMHQSTGKYRYSLFLTEPDKFPMIYTNPEEFVLNAGYVCPPSWLYRKVCYPENSIRSSDGTFVLFTHFLCTTKVFAMSDVTATYRIIEESASHSLNYEKMYNRARNILETQFKLIELYSLSSSLKEKCTIKYYKACLPGFVIHGKHEDIEMAKIVLVNKSLRDRILIFISNARLSFLLKIVYRIMKK